MYLHRLVEVAIGHSKVGIESIRSHKVHCVTTVSHLVLVSIPLVVSDEATCTGYVPNS